MRCVGALASIALALTSAGTARAAPEHDPDAAAEARSETWESALEPSAVRFRPLWTAVLEALRAKGQASTLDLDRAAADLVALDPDADEGHWLMGLRAERRHDWSACAAAYARIVARPRHPERPRSGPVALVGTRARRAICLAHAGQLPAAQAALATEIATGPVAAEVWLRAGEFALARGQFDDAIGHLERAREHARLPPYDPMTAERAVWLIALTHDRAGRRSDAAQELGTLRAPPGWLMSSEPPLLPTIDPLYLSAMWHEASGQLGAATVLARAHARQADRPIHPRALQRLRALEARVARPPQASGVAGPTINALVAPRWPALRACAAASPTLVARVEFRPSTDKLPTAQVRVIAPLAEDAAAAQRLRACVAAALPALPIGERPVPPGDVVTVDVVAPPPP